MDSDKPIIVIKKKGGHGGHHGGAWKVAYADFVTAMMAFFMVMWLVNSASTPTKERIASYFRRPGLFQEGSGTPLEVGGSGILDDAYVPSYPEERQNELGESQVPRRKGFDDGPFPATEETLGQSENKVPQNDETPKRKKHPGEEQKPDVTPVPGGGAGDVPEQPEDGIIVDKEIVVPEDMQTPPPEVTVIPTPPPKVETSPQETAADAAIEAAKTPAEMAEALKDKLESSPELQALLGAVDITANADSVNLEIMDTEKVSMFASGSAYVRDEARNAFTLLAQALGKVHNRIEIAGHTDAHPFSNRDQGYSNWELSVDRANAARRLLVQNGVDAERIQGIFGKAATQPRTPADPFAASNRRITIKLKFDPKVALAAEPKVKDDEERSAGRAPANKGAGTKDARGVRELPDDVKVSPEELEHVHALTSEEVVEALKQPKKAPVKTGPPSTVGSPVEWKDPVFFGDK